jgi:ribosomal protein S18 acetylase RimI-like enzyme
LLYSLFIDFIVIIFEYLTNNSDSIGTFKSPALFLSNGICVKSMKLKEKSNIAVVMRKMTIADYDSLIKLWKEGNIPYRSQGRDSKKNIRWQLQQPNCIYLVAEDNGTMVGAILGTHDGRKGWINRLIVTSAYRQRGIAKRLIEDFEQRLAALGINIVACLIEDWNTASMQVFKQLGYTKHTDILYFSKRKNMKT